ncbi:bile acid-CoA:amino acid N-acyltransferase-like [Arapaima gigas]
MKARWSRDNRRAIFLNRRIKRRKKDGTQTAATSKKTRKQDLSGDQDDLGWCWSRKTTASTNPEKKQNRGQRHVPRQTQNPLISAGQGRPGGRPGKIPPGEPGAASSACRPHERKLNFQNIPFQRQTCSLSFCVTTLPPDGARLVSDQTRMCGTCPLLTVQPSRGLIDEKIAIIVKYLPPYQEVTLHSLHQSENHDHWEAFGHYISDAKGTVTVAEDASVGGTYEGIEPMGLLWSMRPVPGSKPGLRLRKKNVQTPMVVQISVYNGHLSQGFWEEVALAGSTVERWYMAPGVRRVDITEDGVRGTLFLPPGPGPFPGVLDMWGSGGGLMEYRSALLASHGFAALALEYFPPEETMVDIHLPYFEKAFRVLQEHPLVASKNVALLGLSLGSSICLSMAVYSEDVQPKCCVCVSGTHTCPVKTSFSPVSDFLKNLGRISIDEKNRLIWRDIVLPIPTDPRVKIDVRKVKCPLLLVNGLDDQSWPTPESAEDIQQMMEKAGNSHLLTVLSYPGAGHLIEMPYTPHCHSSTFTVKHSQYVMMLWGGRTKPHADAQEHSWGKILEFLQQHLCYVHDPVPLARL